MFKHVKGSWDWGVWEPLILTFQDLPHCIHISHSIYPYKKPSKMRKQVHVQVLKRHNQVGNFIACHFHYFLPNIESLSLTVWVPSSWNWNFKVMPGFQHDILTVARKLLGNLKIYAPGLDILISERQNGMVVKKRDPVVCLPRFDKLLDFGQDIRCL